MDEWIRGPVIGRGATATVSIASSISEPHRLFAVKSSDLSESVFLQNEQSILSKFPRHPNVVEYLGSDVTREPNGSECFNLMTEYVPGGTLGDEIRKNGGKLSEDMIRFYTLQILLGLEFLHENGIVHCDVKPENVLLGGDADLGKVAKIADLGFAKRIGDAGFSGTPVFMAPEVARGEEQRFAADVWALGCTIVEMATGRNAWPEETDPVSALYRIGFSGVIPSVPGTLSEKGRSFVARCLMKCPAERWTAKELLRHPFVSELGSEVKFEARNETRNSPNCVLDLAFWDQIEPDDDDDETDEDEEASSNSALERIGHLLDSHPPSWTFGESWVTVRTNCMDQQSHPITQTDHIDQNGSRSSALQKNYKECQTVSSSSYGDHREESPTEWNAELVLSCLDSVTTTSSVSVGIPFLTIVSDTDDAVVDHKYSFSSLIRNLDPMFKYDEAPFGYSFCSTSHFVGPLKQTEFFCLGQVTRLVCDISLWSLLYSCFEVFF